VQFDKLITPSDGEKIGYVDEKISVPDNPIIPFIEGDGVGPDVTKAMKRVLDSAVLKAYGGKKKIVWFEIYASFQTIRSKLWNIFVLA
jgi:isocitrate dehydrogenase